MSDIIQLLPDHVANQIAAGEVVQRPASVVKELLENAIDAGATSIKLLLKDAGKTLIQVIDDGKGMSTTDARMSFERHATSKIQKAEDLCKKSALIKQCYERAGDVDVLLADSSKAQAILGWEPKHSDLTTILTSALAWEQLRKRRVNKTKRQCL